ncbi:Flp pilus assembly protein CpaB [Ferrimonas aestuarii]|nr:Flp pilus assembly protein CpaB [Ferrimonas aestuarii]
MSSKMTFVIAFVAVMFGLLGILDLLQNQEPPPPVQVVAKPEVKMLTLWQASTAITAGHKINTRQLTPVNLPETEARLLGVSDNVKLDIDDTTLVARDMSPGEWVFNSDLRRPGDDGYLDLLTTKGMTLYPLTVSAKNLIDDYIQPGDHIDVLAVSSPNKNLSKTDDSITDFEGVAAEVLLNHVKVMALDKSLTGAVNPRVASPDELSATVVIEVQPQVLSRLALAQRTMHIEIYRSSPFSTIPGAEVSDVIKNYNGVVELRGNTDNGSDISILGNVF